MDFDVFLYSFGKPLFMMFCTTESLKISIDLNDK